ncbi:tetratricopeptide repeat protein, partial [Oxalobacter paraformigenes]
MKPVIKTFFLFLFLIPVFSVQADNAAKGDRLYKAGKYEEALRHYLKPDAQEKPEVMNRIGYMHNYGRGVEKNTSIGVQWYRKAAELGFAKSQYNLGQCYQFGTGVKKNLNEAIKWFRKSAEQEYADAERKIGYLTVTGTGVKQDFGEAMQWFRRAAGHGNIRAYADIAHAYAEGYGVKKNKNRAV